MVEPRPAHVAAENETRGRVGRAFRVAMRPMRQAVSAACVVVRHAPNGRRSAPAGRCRPKF